LYCLSFLLAIVLFVLSFGHCIVYPLFWPLYCLSFLFVIRKDRQYNCQKKGQTIQWPNKRTNNTMAKRKDRQYNDKKKEGSPLLRGQFSSITLPQFRLKSGLLRGVTFGTSGVIRGDNGA
jgi:hypothetical protein